MSEQPAGMISPSAEPVSDHGLDDTARGFTRSPTREPLPSAAQSEAADAAADAAENAPDAEPTGDGARPLSRYARASVVRPKGAGPGAQPSLIEVEQVTAEAGEAEETSEGPTTRKYAPIEPDRQVEQLGLPAEATPEPERVPFWKRIAMPRSPSTAKPPQPGPLPNLDPILGRIKQLEEAMTTHQAATFGRLDSFEQNITRLWELEEQMALTEVRERLALLEANQEEIADGLHAVARNLSILAVVLALAVGAASLGLGLLL